MWHVALVPAVDDGLALLITLCFLLFIVTVVSLHLPILLTSVSRIVHFGRTYFIGVQRCVRHQ